MRMKLIILNVLFFMVLILGSELIISFSMPLNRDEMIYNMLEPDSSKLWKVRNELNTNFFGREVSTNSSGYRINKTCSPESKKVGLFGASPSWGWGISQNETYLELIQKSFDSEKFCFMNFSMIGYSSSQGVKVFDEISEKYKLDYAIITYMVNDLDFVRFFYESENSDNKKLQEIHGSSSIWLKYMWRSNIFRLAKRIAHSSKRSSIEMISSDFLKLWPGERRVEANELIRNHETITAQANRKKIKLIYVRLPIGVKFFHNLHVKNCNVKEYNKDKFIEIGMRLKKKKQSALLEINNDLKKCPTHFQANFLKLFSSDEKTRKILNQYNRSSAIYTMKALDSYDDMLKSYLKSKNISSYFFSIPEKREELDKIFFANKNDYIHTNSSGQIMIANQLIPFLKGIL